MCVYVHKYFHDTKSQGNVEHKCNGSDYKQMLTVMYNSTYGSLFEKGKKDTR